MDAALVAPPGDGNVPLYFKKQSPGVCFLASYLRENDFETLVIDAYLFSLAVSEIVEQVLDLNPLLVGLSIPDVASVQPMMEVARSLRAAGLRSHITAGGYIPTVASEEILNSLQVDSLICGEGELSLLALMYAVKDKRTWEGVPGIRFRRGQNIIAGPPGRPVQDLDQLPFMARDGLPYVLKSGAGEADISTSRGCYGRCSFCCMPAFYKASGTGGWRGRTAQNIWNEIEFLIRTYGVRDFHFTDENFVGHHQKARMRASELVGLLEKKPLDIRFKICCRADDVDRDLFQRLKQVGLRGVFLGLESGVQTMLDRFNKRITVRRNIEALHTLEELEIEYFPSFIMMDAFTSLAEFRENLNFLRSNSIPLHPGYLMERLVVIPGTETQRLLSKQGILLGDFWQGYSYPIAESMERLSGILQIILRPLVILFNSIDEKLTGEGLLGARLLLKKTREKISAVAVGLADRAAQHVQDTSDAATDPVLAEELLGQANDFTDDMCKLMGLLIRITTGRD